MDLSLTPEEVAVRDAFAAFFADRSPISVVRAGEPLGYSPDVWSELVAMGAPAMSVAVERGGGGGGLAAAVLVAEQVGRHLAPVPFIEHLVAARLLERAGAAGDAIAPTVEGAVVTTLCLHPVGTVATYVPSGAIAGRVVALDAVSGELVVVDDEPSGESVPNLASAPIADRRLDRSGAARRVLASGDRAALLHAAAVDEWRLLTAAALVGVADEAMRVGVQYVSSRHQFGVPIGTFQAIQHGLAELSGPINGARLLVAKGAWAVDSAIGDVAGLAAMAFVFTSELAERTCQRALHYHGGYGVMEEYDIQLFLRRAKGWPLLLDDPARELHHLADVVLGTVAG